MRFLNDAVTVMEGCFLISQATGHQAEWSFLARPGIPIYMILDWVWKKQTLFLLCKKIRRLYMIEKKDNKKIMIAAVVLVVLLAAAWFGYQQFAPKGTAGAKAITVRVVHGDGSEKDFKYDTDEEFLGAVIKAEQLVAGEDGQYGMYITAVDGETADDSKQQWWCLTKGGGQVNTSADQTPIADGDIFELTLTEGF